MRIALHVLHYYADYCLLILASKMREKAISGMQAEAVREVSKQKSKPWTYIHLYLVVVLIHMSYKNNDNQCMFLRIPLGTHGLTKIQLCVIRFCCVQGCSQKEMSREAVMWCA